MIFVLAADFRGGGAAKFLVSCRRLFIIARVRNIPPTVAYVCPMPAKEFSTQNNFHQQWSFTSKVALQDHIVKRLLTDRINQYASHGWAQGRAATEARHHRCDRARAVQRRATGAQKAKDANESNQYTAIIKSTQSSPNVRHEHVPTGDEAGHAQP